VTEQQAWTLDRVEREIPEVAALARLHLRIEEALAAVAGSATPPLPSVPGVLWLQGTPLLDAAEREATGALVRGAFDAAARAVAESSAEADRAVAAILAALPDESATGAAILASFREEAWAPPCPHPQLARFVALRAVSVPARALVAAYGGPLPDRWKRTRCPWCGVPAAASVARTGSGRTLLCVLCGGRWETSEKLCTSCGERNLDRFRVLAHRDAGPATLETCGTCGTAIKVFAAGDVGWGPPLALEAATVRLDLVAERDASTFRDPLALAALFPPA